MKFALPALAVAGVAAVSGLATRAASDERPAHAPARTQPLLQSPALHTDRTEIQGTWIASQLVTTVRAGQPLPPKDEPVVWTIDGDRIVATTGAPDDPDNAREDIDRYVLNPAVSPKTIDLRSAAYGPIKGIYRLEGDTLTICYGFSDRPAAFREPADSQSVLLVFKRARPAAQRRPARFPNAEGCEWALFPTSLGGSNSQCTLTRGGFVMTMDYEAGGPLRVSLAHPGRRGESPTPKYVAVAFDAGRRRYPLMPLGGGEGGDPNAGPTVVLSQFSLDPKVLPAEKVTHVGIELVTAEARALAARSAQEKARAAGLEVLPIPLVGKPFEFTLTTLDGKPFRSRDLRGKVIVLDCWATWCSPCMAKMPALKALYTKRHGDGLEVLGLNFDHKPETARKAIDSAGLPWPQAQPPGDEGMRELWNEAAQIEALPRIYLIDRHGILRSVGGPNDLTARVGALLDETSKP